MCVCVCMRFQKLPSFLPKEENVTELKRDEKRYVGVGINTSPTERKRKRGSKIDR